MHRPSPALVVASIALVVAAGGGAMAAIPGADGTIHGCIGARGALRVIEPPATCEAGETALDFNQTGPPGERGPAGPAGQDLTPEQTQLEQAADAPPARVRVKKPKLSRRQALGLKPEKQLEAFSVYRDDKQFVAPAGRTVASMALPPGRWVISAKAMVFAGPASCVLQAGADVDEVFALLTDAVSLMVVHRFTDVGQVILRCKGRKPKIVHVNPLSVAGSTVNRVKITAVEVDKLTNQKAKEAIG
jgi:hypothetical protein